MKKLIILTLTITALFFGAVAIANAQPRYKNHKKQKQVLNQNADYYPIGYYNGYYNRRGVYIYYINRRVWKRGRLYKNTYKVREFPNGRRKFRLVKSVQLHRHYGKRVYYRTVIEKRGWRTYRVTYKITRFPNGRIKKKVVKKERLYNNRNW